MNKKTNYKLNLLILILATGLVLQTNVLAADTFDISYVLTEGGSRLELDATNAYKGVQLQVTSTVATQYQIIQNVVRPLENRDNPSILLEGNFVLRGLRGTNRFGNFRVPTNDTPVRSSEILYISDTVGDGDSITLVYGLTNIENITPGYYQGQISFTLRPIGSVRAEVTKYLYLYVTISQSGQIKPSIEITTATGTKTIVLNPKKDETKSADILVKINGSFKKMFSILQFLPMPIESNDGSQLDCNIVSLTVKEAKKGLGTQNMPLSSQFQTLYTSSPNGEADDAFIITYSLADLSGQKADRYTSRIQYLLEEMGTQTKLETLGLEIENERIFDLSIIPQDQKGVIEFRNLKPRDPAKQNEVVIQINTNIARQYQVSQKVSSNLTNKEGNIIPSEYFNLRTEDLDTKGTLKFPQDAPIQKGETVLFVSDAKGSADKFKVIYELTCPENLKAGDYSARITYSLLEI
jgi:hypothetical protein